MKPLSFSQRWKVATVALVAGAGMVATALLGWLVWIVWKGTWTVAVEALRMNFLGHVAIGMIVLMGLAMLGLLFAQRGLSKLSGKFAGGEIEVGGD